MFNFVGPLLALTAKPPAFEAASPLVPPAPHAASSGVGKYDLMPRCPLPQLHLLKSADVFPPWNLLKVTRAALTIFEPKRYVLPIVNALFLPFTPLSVASRFPLTSNPTG